MAKKGLGTFSRIAGRVRGLADAWRAYKSFGDEDYRALLEERKALEAELHMLKSRESELKTSAADGISRLADLTESHLKREREHSDRVKAAMEKMAAADTPDYMAQDDQTKKEQVERVSAMRMLHQMVAGSLQQDTPSQAEQTQQAQPPPPPQSPSPPPQPPPPPQRNQQNQTQQQQKQQSPPSEEAKPKPVGRRSLVQEALAAVRDPNASQEVLLALQARILARKEGKDKGEPKE